MISKAHGRIDSPCDLPTAVKFFQKLLTEHRTPDILNELCTGGPCGDREGAAGVHRLGEGGHHTREEGNALFRGVQPCAANAQPGPCTLC